MIRAVLLLAASSACEAFRTTAFSVGAVQTPVTARDRRPARAADVVMGDYTLDNMVLDGPLQPLKDQVLVKLAGAEKQTKGGLFLTGEMTDKPTRGTVVAAGPGKPHPYTDVMITNPIKAGDTILFGSYTGTKVKYCQDDHVMLSMDEVLATVTDKGVVPVRDRAMLKPIEKPVETSTGIVLTKEASKAQEVPNQGEVIAVGEGRFTAKGTLSPVPMKVGDKVMYTKYGGIDVEYEGQKLVFVFAADCLAKY